MVSDSCPHLQGTAIPRDRLWPGVGRCCACIYICIYIYTHTYLHLQSFAYIINHNYIKTYMSIMIVVNRAELYSYIIIELMMPALFLRKGVVSTTPHLPFHNVWRSGITSKKAPKKADPVGPVFGNTIGFGCLKLVTTRSGLEWFILKKGKIRK